MHAFAKIWCAWALTSLRPSSRMCVCRLASFTSARRHKSGTYARRFSIRGIFLSILHLWLRPSGHCGMLINWKKALRRDHSLFSGSLSTSLSALFLILHFHSHVVVSEEKGEITRCIMRRIKYKTPKRVCRKFSDRMRGSGQFANRADCRSPGRATKEEWSSSRVSSPATKFLY